MTIINILFDCETLTARLWIFVFNYQMQMPM